MIRPLVTQAQSRVAQYRCEVNATFKHTKRCDFGKGVCAHSSVYVGVKGDQAFGDPSAE